MKTTRPILTAILTTGLLVAASAGAQGRSAQDANTRADRARPGMERTFGSRDMGRFAGGETLGRTLGARLALGTVVTVEVYDTAPGEGVEPVETFTLIVGQDSEVAFAETLAAARDEAAYLRIETGAQTRTIDLPDEDELGEFIGRRGHGGRPGLAPSMAGLETGDVVSAVFYDGDPDEGAGELTRLTFTYGESSAIGFRHDLAEAAEDADYVTITTPATERLVDVATQAERSAAARRMPRFGAPQHR